MATWQTILVSKFIIASMRSKETKAHVEALSKFLDERIDEQFGSKSEVIQKGIVEKILLPIAGHLMREQYDDFLFMLDEIRKGE